MNQAEFEELVLSMNENPSASRMKAVLDAFQKAEGAAAELAGKMEILWDAWAEVEMIREQAEFCVELASAVPALTPAFRPVLENAMRTLLPRYLGGNPFIRALGLRDNNVHFYEMVWRFRKLLALRNGMILFRAGSWSVAGAPDDATGALTVTAYGGRGYATSVPIESVLKEAALLAPGLETNRITDPARVMAMTGGEFRAMVRKKAMSSVSENQMRAMAQSVLGNRKNEEEFAAWWSNEEVRSTTGVAVRTSSNGRSLQEIMILLDKEAAEGKNEQYGEADVAALTAFFTRLLPETARRQSADLGKVIARLVERTRKEDLQKMFQPLCSKAPFWPADPMRVPLEQFAVWGSLPAKNLTELARATGMIFDVEYLAGCVLRLPLKALNAVCMELPPETLLEILRATSNCSCDLLLWVWKNRKKAKLPEDVMKLICIDEVVHALSQEKLPREWGPAQRELKVHFLEKKDFHEQLIRSAEGDAESIASTLQGALFLSPGERQSLLVKLSSLSKKLTDLIENGAGQKILNAGLSANDRRIDVPDTVEVNYTSAKSFERLMAELNDIINVQQPENREALAVARAHGDFRENAEFDAAKERRNFLSRRRSELERELGNLQTVSFANVSTEMAEIGTMLDLEDASGKAIRYYLLGAWDGNPEKNYLAYRTPLGKALLHHRAGDVIQLPDGRKVTLKAISALPADVLAEME
ncbi:MAG: GreA/GreB family elongation factor [Lentisphaeria bacterium]|nr:GreA/GreB family elongation factor [Lentisphaeria bacterium]